MQVTIGLCLLISILFFKVLSELTEAHARTDFVVQTSIPLFLLMPRSIWPTQMQWDKQQLSQ